MNESINPTAPISGAYTPYFYQSGLYRMYRPEARNAPPTATNRAVAMYLFSADQDLVRRLDYPQTVEQIIARGYFSIPYGEPTTALISDRTHAAWLGLDDVIRDIHTRIAIYQKNMDDLSLSACEANNALFRQEAAQGCPANEKQRYSVNKMMQKLYEEHRSERVNLWRDVSRVRANLPELVQQYLAGYRKLSLLDDLRGDEP